MMIRNLFTLSMLITVTALSIMPASAANLYRFTNQEGNQAIGTSLPPDAAQHGYDILDAQSMRLIKRVQPALTAEQIADLEQKERDEKVAAEKKQQQAIYDRRLLSLYQSEQDVFEAKQRDVTAKELTLEQAKANQIELKAERKQYQQRAAEEELSGGITAKTQKRMAQNAQRLIDTEQLINALEKEIASLTAQYEADAARLKQLRR